MEVQYHRLLYGTEGHIYKNFVHVPRELHKDHVFVQPSDLELLFWMSLWDCITSWMSNIAVFVTHIHQKSRTFTD